MAYIMLLKTTIWWSHHTRTSAWSWTPSPTRWAFRSLPWPCRVRCSKSCGRHKNPPYLPSGRWSEKWKRSQQWLIGGLETWIFFWLSILGISSAQLTYIFFRGIETTNQYTKTRDVIHQMEIGNGKCPIFLADVSDVEHATRLAWKWDMPLAYFCECIRAYTPVDLHTYITYITYITYTWEENTRPTPHLCMSIYDVVSNDCKVYMMSFGVNTE